MTGLCVLFHCFLYSSGVCEWMCVCVEICEKCIINMFVFVL